MRKKNINKYIKYSIIYNNKNYIVENLEILQIIV